VLDRLICVRLFGLGCDVRGGSDTLQNAVSSLGGAVPVCQVGYAHAQPVLSEGSETGDRVS
jgi:hypothetical protein